MDAAHTTTATNGSELAKTSGVWRLENLRINRLGMIAFDCQFPGMKKSADFVISNLGCGSHWQVAFKGEFRVGFITMFGDIFVTHDIFEGASNQSLPQARRVGKINAEDLFNLKNKVLEASHQSRRARSPVFSVVPSLVDVRS